jgi:catechol 2,3-dioxygenase-like lactoylglutathione lyase family enzyme
MSRPAWPNHAPIFAEAGLQALVHPYFDPETQIGPVFFEFIQRKRDEGFGEGNFTALLAARAHVEAQGIDVLGTTWHGIFRSIYFFDPNGHRLELACNVGAPEQYDELKRVAPLMLQEWSRTKRAPRHAEWLHKEPGA